MLREIQAPKKTIDEIIDCGKSYDLIFTVEILNNFPDMWVAAYRGNLVATASDHETLLRNLDERLIPSGYCAIGYVPWLIDETKGK